MHKLKLWLILGSIGLIALDKFSFISSVRDYFAVNLQQQISSLVYRVKSYPSLVLLNIAQQKQLAQENIRLKQQIEEYSISLKQIANKNNHLQSIKELNPAGIYDDFMPIMAKAILDVNFFANNQLLIDKGADNGVESGFAVVNKDGIIGQISSVNASNSQLRMLTHRDYKIYLQHESSNIKMLAVGGGNNRLIIEHIAKDDDIKIGDILVTTGLDDIYPANIPVARIDKIFYANNGFNSALCTPVVDFNQLEYVLVLKNAAY